MNITKSVTITMSEEEAAALNCVLGKQSDTDRKSWGLSDSQIMFLHDLYNKLPFLEDFNDEEAE